MSYEQVFRSFHCDCDISPWLPDTDIYGMDSNDIPWDSVRCNYKRMS